MYKTLAERCYDMHYEIHIDRSHKPNVTRWVLYQFGQERIVYRSVEKYAQFQLHMSVTIWKLQGKFRRVLIAYFYLNSCVNSAARSEHIFPQHWNTYHADEPSRALDGMGVVKRRNLPWRCQRLRYITARLRMRSLSFDPLWIKLQLRL